MDSQPLASALSAKTSLSKILSSDGVKGNFLVLRSSIKAKDRRETRKLSFLLYRMLYGPLSFVRAGYSQLLMLLCMFIFGTFVFSHYEGLPSLLALFASVSTVTTIGLFTPNNGNVFAMNRNEVIMVIVLMIISVASGASLLQSTISVASSERGRAEAKKRLLKRLKKHIIVYGYNHMGKYVDEKLDEIGFDYVVISRDANVVQDLTNDNVFAVLETQTDPIKALKSAGIDKASKIIVADTNDSENIRFILTARKLRPDIKIHTVVQDPSLVETAKDAGADLIIPSSVAVGRLLAFSAGAEDYAGMVFLKGEGSRGLLISEFRINTSSPLIGKRLQQVAEHAKIVGVERGGTIVGKIFDGSFTLKENDTLLVIDGPSNLRKFEEKES